MAGRLSLHTVKSWITRLEAAFQQRFALFLALMVVGLILNEYFLFGFDFTRWDPLLISGELTFIIALRLAFTIPAKVNETIDRLIHRGTLQSSPEQLTTFNTNLKTRSERWADWTGILLGLLTLAAFLLGFGIQEALVRQPFFTFPAMLGAYFVGRLLGRTVLYGRLGSLLRVEKISILVQPGHLDGVAGLKPIGDLYFYQAMLVAIPALFLAAWWIIIPLIGRYTNWRDPYLVLMVAALFFEILAFFLPMWTFHKEMQAQKKQLLQEADTISQRAAAIQAEIIQAESEAARKTLKDEYELIIERYWSIERMPTWPVDVRIRRQFAINNLALFLPLISQVFKLSETWSNVLKEIQNILRNLS
ncbi:MAG: hypothetical protein JSV61_01410 [Anaerolineales bacterium]|nr:MAG: hypothetical protein JSV61_01410 [Anaerolineales bacterium]